MVLRMTGASLLATMMRAEREARPPSPRPHLENGHTQAISQGATSRISALSGAPRRA